jgi:hypothetical protein
LRRTHKVEAFSVKRLLSIIAAVLSAGVSSLGLTNSSCAETRKLGGMMIELPAAYDTAETSSGLTLKKIAGRGKALIVISNPLNAVATPQQAIAKLVDQFRTSFKNATRIIQRDGENANGAPMRQEIWIFQQPSATANFVVVAPPKRIHIFSLLMVDVDRETMKAVEAEFDELVKTAKLDDADKGFRLEPEPGAGGLDGLYTHFRMRLTLNAFGGMDSNSEMEVLYFAPDGLFSREPPTEQNLRAFCALPSTACGTYGVKTSASSTEQLELRDPQGGIGMFRRSLQTFKQRDETLTIGSDEWRKVKPARDLKLDGRWDYFTASSGTTAYSSGGYFNSDSIVFTSAGRFTRSGGSGIFTKQSIGDGSTTVAGNNPRAEVNGTYSIDGFTLSLTEDDGTVNRVSFFTNDEAKPDLLVIDGRNYTRK